jgi:hypothetical protein
MVMEGMGVSHLHLKLYPLHGLEKEGEEHWGKEERYFGRYEGYISTQMGPKANMESLGALQVQINNSVALN